MRADVPRDARRTVSGARHPGRGTRRRRRRAAPSRFRWVFDPLDGTTNYAHGLPIYCSSLALEIDGRAEVAAIYDPTRKELFTAERGEGAYLNGRALRVSPTATLIDSLLVTGFPYNVHEESGDLVELFGYFLGRARAVRRLGSAALDLCYVAAGRFEAFWEQHLKPWDVAAGALIVEEAGGRVTGMDGAPFDAAPRTSSPRTVMCTREVVDTIRRIPSRTRAKSSRAEWHLPLLSSGRDR